MYVLSNYYGFYGRSHDPGNRGRSNSGPQQVDCAVSCGIIRFPVKCNGNPATLECAHNFGKTLRATTGSGRSSFAVDDSTLLSRLVASLPP